MNKLKKIIEYGIYVLVFLLPWQTKLILRQEELGHGPWEYGMISLYGTDILAVVLLILFFISSCREGKNSQTGTITVTHPGLPATPLKRGLIIILSGLDLIIFISIFFAPDTILAIYRYLIFLLGIGLFWLMVKVEYDKVKLAIAFFSALAIQGVLSIWQFLTQSTFASKWLGMSLHSAKELGASTIETVSASGIPERWLRAYGSLDHPNILGGVLAAGLIILIIAIINNKRIDNKKSDWKFIIYYLSFIIVFAALLFSFSRSAWLAFTAGFFTIFIFSLVKNEENIDPPRPSGTPPKRGIKNWLAVKRLGGAVLILAIVFGAIFINYQNLFITRAGGSARLEVKSFSERKMYLEDSFNLLKTKWLFGAGIGNYTKALADSKPQQPWYYLQPVHNVFLLAWAETGIFGLLFFLAFLGILFWRTIKNKNVLSLSLLLILVIIMSLDHYLWSLHFGILSFWLLTGYIYREIKVFDYNS